MLTELTDLRMELSLLNKKLMKRLEELEHKLNEMTELKEKTG